MERIIEPLQRKEGVRHLWLGDSRMGKTYANRALLGYIRKRCLVDVVLTIDDKSRWKAQYDGTFRANPSHLRKTGILPGDDAGNIVFRGVATTLSPDDSVEPEDVAEMAWEMIRAKPCTVLLNIDELADATNGNQNWKGTRLPQLYRKGGGIGLSVVATTQLPQMLPREAFGLSETIGIFRMSGREAEYLYKYRVIEEVDIDAIQNLKIGEWLMYQKSTPRDANVYRI
jgi:hypothetical protein